jgi:hypothetical protein
MNSSNDILTAISSYIKGGRILIDSPFIKDFCGFNKIINSNENWQFVVFEFYYATKEIEDSSSSIKICDGLIFSGATEVYLTDIIVDNNSKRIAKYFTENKDIDYYIAEDIKSEFGYSLTIAVRIGAKKWRKVYLFDEIDTYISNSHGLDIDLYKKLTEEIMAEDDVELFVENTLNENHEIAAKILAKYENHISS